MDEVEYSPAVRPSSRQRSVVRQTRPVGAFVLTLAVVLTLNFLLPRIMPGDPITALEDPTSTFYVNDGATRAALLRYYGLDRPLAAQYAHYVLDLATGNLGWSIRMHAPVATLIRDHLPWTLLLVVPSLAVASLISLVAGAHAGWTRGSTVDRALILLFSAVRTVPAFLLGTLALLVLSARLGWFPLGGARTPFASYATPWAELADILRHWALPAAVLTVELLGGQFLLMRNSMVSVLGEDFMLVARAKGLARWQLKYRHGVRNAILPFFTLLWIQLGFAVTGTIFVEAVFSYPGMGTLTVQAVGARDYPLLQGIFLVFAVAVLTANLVADLTYARLDPRVRVP